MCATAQFLEHGAKGLVTWEENLIVGKVLQNQNLLRIFVYWQLDQRGNWEREGSEIANE